MRRFLAVFAVVMCLAGCMVPTVFAADVLAASSDFRIAGFQTGLSTIHPRPSFSDDRFGGLIVHGNISCTSVYVSDVEWRSDSSDYGGHFWFWYTINIEPITKADIDGNVIAMIPVEYDGSVAVKYSCLTQSDMSELTCNVTSTSSTHLGVGIGERELQGFNTPGKEYVIDMTGQKCLRVYWYPTDDTVELTQIRVGVQVWDPHVSLVTSMQYPTISFGTWLSKPFELVGAAGGVILTFFSTIMNTNLVAPIVGVSGSLLLMLVIIGIVR